MESICNTEEMEWFANADFSMYEGKYIATVGKEVAAFGDNAKLVWEEAKRKFPWAEPIIAKIPTGDWAMVEEVPLLLGRMDIFDKFEIVFTQKEKKIVLYLND